VIAESFERIHRSNLVGMGVLPLTFHEGTSRKTLALDGSEVIDLTGLAGGLSPRMTVTATIRRTNGTVQDVPLLCRLDTLDEVEYFRHGGILHYVLRQLLAKGKAGRARLRCSVRRWAPAARSAPSVACGRCEPPLSCGHWRCPHDHHRRRPRGPLPLLRLLQQVERGEEVVITRRGKGVATLRPSANPAEPNRKGGWMKGKIWMADELRRDTPGDHRPDGRQDEEP